MPAIGIDLGTTFSCVGVWYQGKVEIIANGLGSRTTPSWVAFTESERLVGEPARCQAARNAANTVYDVKRLLGRRFGDPVVQQDIQRWPFHVIDDGGRPVIEINEGGRERLLDPVEISAMILDHMRKIAEAFLGCSVTDAVVTVPAYFNDAQRQATKDAGTVAGLNVLRILNEPTAAALAYGQLVEPRPLRHVLIFDLGGGTFDVSVLTIREGLEFEVRATAGDTHLGGQDFDNLLVQYFIDVVVSRTGCDVSNNPRAVSRLKSAAEKAKHNLSFSTEVNVEVDSLTPGYDFNVRLSRAKFEDLCSALFAQTFEPVRQALTDSGLTVEEIDDIVLVGGSTRIPRIQGMLRTFFKDKPLSVQINPDEAVATGAAIQAAILIGDDSWVIRNLVLRDVIPLSLGIGLEDGGVKRIVARNSHIPSLHSGGTKTCIDDQTAVLFEVYEGERPLARDNNLLGSYVIDEIPAGPRGAVKFDTTFAIDANGILTVTSRELQTGKTQQITINSNEHRCSRAEVHAMLREAQYYRLADESLRRRLAARRNLENRAYAIKAAATSKIAQDTLTPEQQCALKKLYQTELDWLEADVRSIGQPAGAAATSSLACQVDRRIAALEESYRPFATILAEAGYVEGTFEIKQPQPPHENGLSSCGRSKKNSSNHTLSDMSKPPAPPSQPKPPFQQPPMHFSTRSPSQHPGRGSPQSSAKPRTSSQAQPKNQTKTSPKGSAQGNSQPQTRADPKVVNQGRTSQPPTQPQIQTKSQPQPEAPIEAKSQPQTTAQDQTPQTQTLAQSQYQAQYQNNYEPFYPPTNQPSTQPSGYPQTQPEVRNQIPQPQISDRCRSPSRPPVSLLSQPQQQYQASTQPQQQYQASTRPQQQYQAPSQPQSRFQNQLSTQSEFKQQLPPQPQFQPPASRQMESQPRPSRQMESQPRPSRQVEFQPQVSPQFQAKIPSPSQFQSQALAPPQSQFQSQGLALPQPEFQSQGLAPPQPQLQSQASAPPQPQFQSQGLAPTQPQFQSQGSAPTQPQFQSQALAPPQSQFQSQGLASPQPEFQSQAPAPPQPQFQSQAPAPPQPQFQSQAPAPPQPQFQSQAPAPPQPQFQSQASTPPQPQFQSQGSAPTKPQFQSQASAPPQPQYQSQGLAPTQPQFQSQASAPPQPQFQSQGLAPTQPQFQSQGLAPTKPQFQSQASVSPQPQFQSQGLAPTQPQFQSQASASPQPQFQSQVQHPSQSQPQVRFQSQFTTIIRSPNTFPNTKPPQAVTQRVNFA